MKIPLWILNLLARQAAKKLNLTEGPVDGTNKKWYQSKTILSDVATILASTYELVRTLAAPHFGWNLPPIPAWAFTILGAIGIHGRVVATGTITR